MMINKYGEPINDRGCEDLYNKQQAELYEFKREFERLREENEKLKIALVKLALAM